MTHEEVREPQAGYACACGETFPALENLDDHFFAVFTCGGRYRDRWQRPCRGQPQQRLTCGA
jgi:hypothetical protein